MKTPKQIEGYELAKGMIEYIAECLLLIAMMIIAMNFIRLASGFGMDDSDVSRWKRSGLKIYTDAKTGVQYLSDGHGGLVKRETR